MGSNRNKEDIVISRIGITRMDCIIVATALQDEINTLLICIGILANTVSNYSLKVAPMPVFTLTSFFQKVRLRPLSPYLSVSLLLAF